MKAPNAATVHEPVPLVVLLPIEDISIYREARRILRSLMGRKTPSVETLVLHDLRGRDANGIVDHYLDSIAWPLELGRAVTVRMRERAKLVDAPARKFRRPTVKLAKPLSDPARN